MDETEVIVLFVEGDTEVEFYNAIKTILKTKPSKKNNVRIETVNAKGVGQYKNIVFRKFDKSIRTKYPSCKNFHIICAYDTDVFELERKPPVEWNDIKKQFINTGVCTFNLIRAKSCIEDWFLYDLENILRFLRIPLDTKVKGKDGVDKLQNLFKKSNKTYIKGRSTKGFIDALDVEKIMKVVCKELNSLCKYMTLDCKEIKY